MKKRIVVFCMTLAVLLFAGGSSQTVEATDIPIDPVGVIASK